MRKMLALIASLLLLTLPSLALGQTRALLVACHDFLSMPGLGNSVSGNLHIIGSALVGAGLNVGSLSIEDGTIGTLDHLRGAINDAFNGADETDLSILYLCTHGVLSSADDGQVYLMLGDGKSEAPLSAADLQQLLSSIQGEKLLIVDACYSGALIGRGISAQSLLPGSRAQSPASMETPFLADSSIHVLTSASGFESSWYYDSEGLTTGAVSYFASALSSGLGLYGKPEADMNNNGEVTLEELRRYLSAAVPSSSVQLLSAQANTLTLPVATGASLSRALSGFSYGDSLLEDDDPTLEFSYTVTEETAVQYRVVRQIGSGWDWQGATTFLDEGDNGDGLLVPGRKTRELTLDGMLEGESGYLMLQVFAVTGEEVILCFRAAVGRPSRVCRTDGDAQQRRADTEHGESARTGARSAHQCPGGNQRFHLRRRGPARAPSGQRSVDTSDARRYHHALLGWTRQCRQPRSFRRVHRRAGNRHQRQPSKGDRRSHGAVSLRLNGSTRHSGMPRRISAASIPCAAASRPASAPSSKSESDSAPNFSGRGMRKTPTFSPISRAHGTKKPLACSSASG